MLRKAEKEIVLVEISIDGSEGSATWADQITRDQLVFLHYLRKKSKEHTESYGAVVDFKVLGYGNCTRR